MTGVAWRIVEGMGDGDEKDTRVLVVKSAIPKGMFVRDFDAVEWNDDNSAIRLER